jgi:hypothetical protein
VRIGTYLPARMGQGYTFAGSSMVAVNAFDVKSGGATWIDPNVLAAYQNDGETRVVDGPWEISGNRYDARSVTRAGVDSATRFVFDKGTGLLLAQQIATGRRRPGMDDPFMRENMSSLRFQAFRQRSFPWANAPTPEWAKTVRTMSYQGQQTMFMPGMPPYSTPIQLRATLTQRIGGVSIGTSETQYYQQAPQQSLLVIGPGSVGSLWMDPATLRSMRPGPLDLDPLLHSTLAYDFVETPSGRMGVLTESNAARTYRLVWAYDLNDGALRYSAFERWNSVSRSSSTWWGGSSAAARHQARGSRGRLRSRRGPTRRVGLGPGVAGRAGGARLQRRCGTLPGRSCRPRVSRTGRPGRHPPARDPSAS